MANDNDLTKNWTREGLAWAAGLFEGEGCIAVSRKGNHTQWSMILASTDHDVLERFLEVTGMGSITGPFQREANHKPHWIWRTGKRANVYALAVALHPWLGVRRQERVMECLGDIASDVHAFAGRKCGNGHRWSPDTVTRRRYGGRMRRVCKACLADGVIQIQSEVS